LVIRHPGGRHIVAVNRDRLPGGPDGYWSVASSADVA
jgi:hypothetical protein